MTTIGDTARINVRGVSKTFPDGAGGWTSVLEGVDVEVGRHEFVSLLGPSGCGKSTLFDIIAGLEEPSAGSIEIDGSPQRIGHTGYMPQRDLLMPWKRIADNVAVGRIAKGTPRRHARQQAVSILERFGLGEFADHYPSRLSGGMRQRAALARTFLAGDDVLLLDEPFGALDALTRLEMQTWLLGIWRESEASVLFVTHDVDEALRLSDRVYVLTSRPGTVAAAIEVSLPRPRTPGIALTPRFAALKEKALSHLQVGRTSGS